MPTASERPTLEQALPLPERWTFAPSHGDQLDLANYWQLLDDPLINEFVAEARTKNFDLAQASAQLRAAQAALREARAARLPSLSANGGVGRDVGDFASDELRFNLGLDLSWEADLFGRISSSINASEADLRAAGYNLADVERVIVSNVVTQTITARALIRQLEIARASLANQEENLQIARWRQQAGLVSSLDVEQARTQRLQTASAIPQLEADLIATANSISILIGEPPGNVHALLLDSSKAVPAPPANVGVSAPADVLRMRPDVGAAEANLVADLERIGVARSQLYPIAGLTGTLGTSSFGIENLFEVITGNIFANVTQLIFDAGRARAQIDASKAIADGSLAAWRLSILGALEEVETASANLDSQHKRVVTLTEASQASQNAAILARRQYQAGLIDFQVLLDVESALLSSQTSEVSAEAERARAFVQLARAMGGGWTASGAEQFETRTTGNE